MFRFPFYNYPYNYQYYKYYNGYCKDNVQGLESEEEKRESITTSNSNEDSNTTNSRFNPNNSSSEQAIFEIFGLKLYLDDLIILCVLFFLYQQDVKDEMLYIILFLLLIS